MQRSPKIRRYLGLAGLLLLCVIAPCHAEDAGEDRKALENLARSAAAIEFPPLTAHQRFLIGPVERTAELAPCSLPVRAQPTTSRHMADRVTIELKCADTKGWHIYVPVRIIGTSTVAVAVHSLVIGSVLKASDMTVETRDLSELPLGFIDNPQVAAGLTVSRPVPGGAYITNQQLVASRVVQRGQSVTLVADAGGMSIRMAGRALTDGLINQRVKVTNLSSGRTVEGIARSEQVVEIILQ